MNGIGARAMYTMAGVAKSSVSMSTRPIPPPSTTSVQIAPRVG